jgi:hypothetical protein
MNGGLQRVIDRFPQFAASVSDRFGGDQSFRDMCSDYAETMEALQRWEASDSSQRESRVAEYGELAEALESEILAALSAPPKRTMTT